MNSELFLKYGYCEIPKGVVLYRGHEDDSVREVMFFTTKYTPARGFNSRVQVWKSTKKIRLIFLIRHINGIGFANSAIPDLYYDLHPNEENKKLDDLDIKQDHLRRNPFAFDLSTKYNIDGWFTSIEDKVDVEVCLFSQSKIKEHLQLVKVFEKDDRPEDYDSLRKFKLLPCPSFFELSNQKILERQSIINHGKDPYKLYRKYIRACVEDWVERGGTVQDGKQTYYNLRTKFRI